MGTESFNGGIDPNTVHKRAKAWDGYVGKQGEFVSQTAANHFPKVKFDGGSERKGKSTGETKDQIASCREAYENVGLIGNIVDLMVDFAVEGIDIYHSSKPIQKFYRQWAEKVDVNQLSHQILKSIYRDGNVPVLSYWGEISDTEVKNFKRSLGSTDGLFTNTEVDGSKIIPYKFQVLDVLNVDKGGSQMLGTSSWEYQFAAEDTAVLSSDPTDKTSKDAIRKLRNSLGKGEFDKLRDSGKMTLEADRFSMLYYKKDGYRSWATPMLWRVMEDIKFKKLIRDMDISVAEGVTNALTIVKLGSTKDGLPPSQKKYEKIVSMLKNPSKSKTIVWDDLIDVQTVFPPVEKFFSADKYEQVDNDIRSGLGIAEILVNGGGGNYSNSFLSVKTLLERLETGRGMLLDWLNQQVKIVAKNMGFSKAPIIRMRNMALSDQETEKKFILELFDRNAVSYETMLERFGENLEIEMNRIKDEDKTREKIQDKSPFSLLRVGKFGPHVSVNPTAPGAPDMQALINGEQPGEENTNNLPSAQEQNGQKGGSPTGKRGRKKQQGEPRKPVGQSVSSVDFSEDEVEAAFEKAYSVIASQVCQELGYVDARSFKAQDRADVLNAVVDSIAPALMVAKYGDKQVDGNKTKVKANLERCVRESVSSGTNTSVGNSGRSPSKDMVKSFVVEGVANFNRG